ncbi:MAG: hypothetical protein F4134_04845, partial [Acidimicrobiaceae bacterium]|nr:hypothetical protein [Acidimicrobiaceae bacterium]
MMTETQRTTLYNQLTNTIGQEAARTLMEQLPPMGWDQVATKEDIQASETKVLGELKVTEGRLLVQIADSESRLGARIDGMNTRIDETNTRIDGMNTRIDETNTRIDGMNTRIDETNTRVDGLNTRIDETNTRIDETTRELSALGDEVRTGFADLKLALAKQIRWVAA